MSTLITELALASVWTHQRLRSQAMHIARLARNAVPNDRQLKAVSCDELARVWVRAARSHNRQVVRALKTVRQSQLSFIDRFPELATPL